MTRLVRICCFWPRRKAGSCRWPSRWARYTAARVFQQTKVLAQGRVEVRLGQEDQARVRGCDRLKQVLLNLVANALDHTPEGLGDAGVGVCQGVRVSR
jgi:hypothetical protein